MVEAIELASGRGENADPGAIYDDEELQQIRLPGATIHTSSESGAPLGESAGVGKMSQEDEYVAVAVGSGAYTFRWQLSK
jgi:hypothetical protein